MRDRPNLRDDLLKQNGTSLSVLAGIRDRILAEDQRRVRRMRWLMTRCGALFLVFLLLLAFLKYGSPFLSAETAENIGLLLSTYRWIEPALFIITGALFVAVVALTFSFYMQSRTLTMFQIQSSLAGIEEQLKKLADKD